MDRRITLQTAATTTGAQGFPVETFATLDNVWAAKRDISGVERTDDGREHATGTTIWTIRWRNDIDATGRVVYNSVSYDITFTKEMGRRDYLELHTERRTDG